MQEQYGVQGAIVILAIAFGIYLIMKPFTRYLLRRRLMELGQWNEESLRQVGDETELPSDNLKWGLVLLFFGLGLILVAFLPYSYDSSLPYGVVAVSTAIGFLIYYGIVMSRKS
ncbi:hypothetical protein GCM10028803_22590 [Larkinella knui]|uniref:DUF6249 domain-containing protein n=1 Tax=Larkinella knui TaxID=2025310 RepID=A0A3P1CVL8_9BACT|nr:DUF6249 domain-containing protein [Larkinella knui]RRB17333.1 hypothetical protein EHT87_03345 [Larkinella knui]